MSQVEDLNKEAVALYKSVWKNTSLWEENFAKAIKILEDKVSISSPDGSREMMVVMIGDSMEYLDIDDEFVDWVKRDNLLNGKDIV